MAIKLPRLTTSSSITNATGTPVTTFTRFWDKFATAIEQAFADIATAFASITSLNSSVTSINASIGNVTATGLFRVTQGTTESGADATIELAVRSTTSDTFHPASIKLNSKSGATSEVDITADLIKLLAAKIELDGTILSSGGILTSHIASDATTSHGKEDFSGVNSVANTSYHDLTSSGVSTTLTGGTVEIDLSIIVHNSDAGDHPFQIKILKDGSTFKAWPPSGTQAFTAQKSGYTSWSANWHDSDTGSHTYKAQFACPDSNTNLTFEGTLRVDEIKR